MWENIYSHHKYILSESTIMRHATIRILFLGAYGQIRNVKIRYLTMAPVRQRSCFSYSKTAAWTNNAIDHFVLPVIYTPITFFFRFVRTYSKSTRIFATIVSRPCLRYHDCITKSMAILKVTRNFLVLTLKSCICHSRNAFHCRHIHSRAT